jgi:hypothetical protein
MKACIATILAALALTLAAPSASAQEGGARGLGIGAQAFLTSPGFLDYFTSGVSGAALTYDAGMFHIDGIFGLSSFGETGFGLGVQGWYTIHGGGIADLSVGGGLGFADDRDFVNDDGLDVHLEAGLKIRLFLVSNVALSAIVGLGFIFEDDDDEIDDDEDLLVITGQNLGSMGITYFF